MICNTSLKPNFFTFTKALSNVVAALILISIVLATYIIASHKIHYLTELRAGSIVEAYDIRARRISTLFTVVDIFTNESKTHLLIYNYGLREFKIAKVIVDNSTSSFIIKHAPSGNTVDVVKKGLYDIVVFAVPNSRIVIITDNGDLYEIKVENRS